VEPWPLEQAGEVGPLVGRLVVVGEGVDRDHLVPSVEQGLGQVGTDESGGAGDHHVVAVGSCHRRVVPLQDVGSVGGRHLRPGVTAHPERLLPGERRVG
jgi:hypothetical protein